WSTLVGFWRDDLPGVAWDRAGIEKRERQELDPQSWKSRAEPREFVLGQQIPVHPQRLEAAHPHQGVEQVEILVEQARPDDALLVGNVNADDAIDRAMSPRIDDESRQSPRFLTPRQAAHPLGTIPL